MDTVTGNLDAFSKLHAARTPLKYDTQLHTQNTTHPGVYYSSIHKSTICESCPELIAGRLRRSVHP